MTFLPMQRHGISPPGETLFRAGDTVVSMMLLRDGRADLVRHTGYGLRPHPASRGSRSDPCRSLCLVQRLSLVMRSRRLPASRQILPTSGLPGAVDGGPRLLRSAGCRTLARSVQAARVRAETRSLPKVADRAGRLALRKGRPAGQGPMADVAGGTGALSRRGALSRACPAQDQGARLNAVRRWQSGRSHKPGDARPDWARPLGQISKGRGSAQPRDDARDDGKRNRLSRSPRPFRSHPRWSPSGW